MESKGRVLDTEDLHKILRLLSTVILADKKVYKEEVDALGGQLVKMCFEISADLFVTESMVRDWFQANKLSIQTELNGPYRNDFIVNNLKSLGSSPYKEKLYELMVSISHSDGEFHRDERSIIYMAQETWDIK